MGLHNSNNNDNKNKKNNNSNNNKKKNNNNNTTILEVVWALSAASRKRDTRLGHYQKSTLSWTTECPQKGIQKLHRQLAFQRNAFKPFQSGLRTTDRRRARAGPDHRSPC